MIIEEKNKRGQVIGFWSLKDMSYNTTRDASKGQVFYFFDNALAIDLNILKRTNIIFKDMLKNRKVEDLWRMVRVNIQLINFEKSPFIAQINVYDFLIKGDKINYDKRNAEGQNVTGFGEQVRLGLNHFVRIYSNENGNYSRQEVLINEKNKV